MRRLGRFLAAAGLAVAGGLALPGGAAQVAACSGSTGVTVVIDYGSSSTTSVNEGCGTIRAAGKSRSHAAALWAPSRPG